MTKPVFALIGTILLLFLVVPEKGEAQVRIWSGVFSTDWHDSQNWIGNSVPDSGTHVIIPSPCLHYPDVQDTPGHCLSLLVQDGSFLSVTDQDLYCKGNATMQGNLIMNGNADVTVKGDITWQAGSSAATNDILCDFYIYGNWTFGAEAGIQLDSGSVHFCGEGVSWIYSHDTASYFNFLRNEKTAPGLLGIGAQSTADLHLNNELWNLSGHTLKVLSAHRLVLHHGLFNEGIIECDDGTLEFAWGPAIFRVNPGCYLHHLRINTGGPGVELFHPTPDTLFVHGGILFSSGTLDGSYFDISVGQNWADECNGFVPANSTVIFAGQGNDQYCFQGNFNRLTLDKPAGGKLKLLNSTATCSHYDWMAGGIEVIQGGFTANDLEDNGIAGNYILHGGSIELKNFNGPVDLLANLYVYGGSFIVKSNPGISHWPYDGNLTFHQEGGIIQFEDAGIFFDTLPNASFNYSITGGMIRTAGDLYGMNPAFHPHAGNIEMFGTGNNTVQTLPGFAFNHFTAAKDGMFTVTAMSALDINGDFRLTGGRFTAPDTLYVGRHWINLTDSLQFIQGDGVVVFDGDSNAVIGTASCPGETFGSVIIDKSQESPFCLQTVTNNYIKIAGELEILDGTLKLAANMQVDAGNVTIAAGAGLFGEAGDQSTLTVRGDWTNENSTTGLLQGFRAPQLVRFTGGGNQVLATAGTVATFNHLYIDKPSGLFKPNNDLQVNEDLSVLGGGWMNNTAGLTHTLHGNLMIMPTGAWYGNQNPCTLVFTGAADQTLSFTGGGFLNDLTVMKSASGEGPETEDPPTVALLSDLPSPGGAWTLSGGRLDLNGHTADAGSVVLNHSAAILEAGAGAVLRLGETGLVMNAGLLRLWGDAADPAVITHHGSVYYHFQLNGGLLQANHAVFEFMNQDGIRLGLFCSVDPAAAFHHCIFRDGQPGGTLLSLTGQSFIAEFTGFPENTWGGNHNVTRTANAGIARFAAYTGAFGGPAYESDPFGRVFWHTGMYARATATPQVIYEGESSQLHVDVYGTTGINYYAWSPATGLSDVFAQSPLATPAATTTYTVTATDYGGNTVSDSVTVLVLPLQGSLVQGNVRYLNPFLTPLSQVCAGLWLGNLLVASDTTDSNGYYEIPYVPAGTFTLRCTSATPWGGVNASDALLVLKHFVGIITLTDVRYKAGDVDNNGLLNSIDALLAVKRFVGVITAFPAGDWAFQEPEVTTGGDDTLTQDILGLCYGETTGNYTPPYRMQPGAGLRANGEIPASPGIITVPVRVESATAFCALSLVLSYPSASIRIHEVLNPFPSGTFLAADHDGELRIAWYGEQPVSLTAGETLLWLGISRNSPVEDLNLEAIPGSAFSDCLAGELPMVSLTYPLITGKFPAGRPVVGNAWPNPFNSASRITCSLPEQAVVITRIADGRGTIVASPQEEWLPAGEHNILIDGNSLSPGIYQCIITLSGKAGTFTETRRLTVAK